MTDAPDRDDSLGAVASSNNVQIATGSQADTDLGPDVELTAALKPDVLMVPEDAPTLPGDEPGLPAEPIETLSAAEALGRLLRGEGLRDVRVERLTFKGEFPRPVRLDRVVLVRPSFDRARFLDEVEMRSCTIDRLRTSGRTTFAKKL